MDWDRFTMMFPAWRVTIRGERVAAAALHDVNVLEAAGIACRGGHCIGFYSLRVANITVKNRKAIF